MNIYDVIDVIENEDNMDKVADILDHWSFQTSINEPNIQAERKEQIIKIGKLGESGVYKRLKEGYKIKI